MAKVAPKTAQKEEVKAKAPSPAQIEKAERQKLIEKYAPSVSKDFVKVFEAEKRTTGSVIELVRNTMEIVEDNGFDKAETRVLVLAGMADAKGIEVSEINAKDNGSLYSQVSRIMTLLFPTGNEKNGITPKKAKANLDKLMNDEDSDYKVTDLIAVASGRPVEGIKASLGRGGDTKAKAAKKAGEAVFDTQDEYEDQIAADIGKAKRSGLTVEQVQEGFNNRLAEFLDEDGNWLQ